MLKYTSLCILCVQNSLLAVLMRLSRVVNSRIGMGYQLPYCLYASYYLHEFNLLREPQRRKRIRESFRAITNSGEL
ncbi:hypothetical protein PsorP6_011810 [Peronosclerospora sorghi]|uniref:Uncharacterized protein n=1 Tax=Peronosclerospora sorghi TaxID=230839 RepID=A0ACC0WI04_9STRA|nr:hypothetical protein PsorP6_011810 [Peronosclerospora sorghi]